MSCEHGNNFCACKLQDAVDVLYKSTQGSYGSRNVIFVSAAQMKALSDYAKEEGCSIDEAYSRAIRQYWNFVAGIANKTRDGTLDPTDPNLPTDPQTRQDIVQYLELTS